MDSKQNRFPSQGPPAPSSPPCGACKFLRRKCVPGCVFAPHFTSDQGPARFAAVHKVFGASNVSKLLQHVPVGRRDDAVVTICYEAQARLTDPVYGCVSTIHALQQQVATLQTELSIVRSHLISSKLAAANSLTGTQQIQQQNSTGVLMQQQSFSNASSASDVVDMSSFTSSGLELISSSVPPSQSAFEQLQLSSTVERGDEEEESDYPVDDFADGVLQHK